MYNHHDAAGLHGPAAGCSHGFPAHHAIAVIDTQVESYPALADALPPGVEVLLLDVHADGIGQVAERLRGRSGIDSIHLVSHGAPGALRLGGAVVDGDALARHEGALRAIGGALAPGGELLLYGCAVASGAAGRAFVERLAALTGASVAASAEPTGASALGGTAALEWRVGEVATEPLFAQAALDAHRVLLATLPATLVPGGGGWFQTNPFGDATLPASIGSSVEIDRFEFVANTTGSYTFTIPSGALDAQFRLYGSDGNPITGVIDNPSLPSATETVTVSLTEGAWTSIAVSGFSTSTGSYTLNVLGPDAIAPDLTPAAPTYAGSFQAAVGNQGDVDYWKVVAPSGTSSLDLSVVPTGIDTYLDFFSATGDFLQRFNNAGVGGTDSASGLAVVAGTTYYIGVSGATRTTVGDYRLGVDFNPDASVNGDPAASVTPDTGTVLKLNPLGDVTRSGSIGTGTEVDLYAFHVETVGNHVVSVSGALDSQLRVYDSSGAALTGIIDAFASGGTETTTQNFTSTGWFYAAVAGFATTTGSYSFSVNGPSYQSVAIATPATAFTGSNTGSIGEPGDVDYWSITAPGGTSLLDLSVVPAASLDSVIELYDSAGTLLQTIDNPSVGSQGQGVTDSASGIAITAGSTYFVGVSSTSRSQTGNYTLSVDFNPDQAFGDPAATVTPNTGTVLKLNPLGDATRSGSIGTGTEVDLYAFHVETAGNHVISVSGAVDAQLRVYDSGGAALTPIIDAFGSGGTETTTQNLTSTGWFYVAVAGFATTTGSYSLSINGPSYDSVAIATPASAFSGSSSGNVNVAGDVDYWTLTAPAGATTLDLTVTPDAALDTLIELYDSAGTLLQTIDNPSVGSQGQGVTDSASGIAVTAGSTYFVGVSSTSRTQTGAYGISVDFDPDQADTFAPTVTRFSPADDATGVAVDTDIVVTFNEPIQRGSGSIVLRDGAGAIVATYAAASSPQLSVSGNALTIDPSANLSPGTGYRVDFDLGSVRDQAGNGFAGTTTYNFTTASLPLLSLSPAATSVGEGDAGSRPVSVTVSLPAAATAAASVEFATRDGTASAGSDYVAASGTLNFAVGERSKSISVSVLGDTAVEGDENFFIELSNAGGATLGGTVRATVTITNDDVTAGGLTLVGTSAGESLAGGAGNDTISALAGADRITGGGGDDTINGGEGVDTAVYAGARSNYALSNLGLGWQVADATGADGRDTVIQVERLAFADGNVAIDLGGSAGITAKTLGAVFGPASVKNPAFVGIGLSLLDSGMSYEALMQLALDARVGANASHAAVVTVLYTNVAGVAPGAADLAAFVALLDNGSFTPASLGVFAAEHALNLGNIDLVGLTAEGLDFS